MTESVIDRLVRPNIKNLKPYQSARGTAKAMEGFTFLDAAENPYSPFSAEDEGARYYEPLNRYPEPQPQALIKRLGEMYGGAPECMILTRGSEEGIRLLMQVFCAPGKEAVLTCPPTFAMYASEAQIHDIENIKVPRTGEFKDGLDVEKIIETVAASAVPVKMIFLCNPGNPSSTALPEEQVEDVVRRLADRCMVVVDEAYIEFAAHESFVRKLGAYPNLIVMRTLSKSYGLAGLRCGAIIAHNRVIDYIGRMIAPYPVPRPTQNLALEAVSGKRYQSMVGYQGQLKSERDRMVAALKRCGSIIRIYPSRTNVLCIEVADVKAAVAFFAENKILIRDRSAAIPGAVNVGVGTPEQNDRVIALFKALKF